MLKIVLGAGGKQYDGWTATERAELDLLDATTWPAFGLEPGTVDAMLAEHVWEHFSPEDARAAAALCHAYLRSGGYLRLAVPDGNHPSPEYIDWVRPGGVGAGSNTHAVLYTHEALRAMLTGAGFGVRLLEWWDDDGQFHRELWDEAGGYIERCAARDPRNDGGRTLTYTSLLLDAVKP